MAQYLIRKRFQWSVYVHGYAGSICQQANVVPSKLYNNRANAEADAKRLSAFDASGFDVVEVVQDPAGLWIEVSG